MSAPHANTHDSDAIAYARVMLELGESFDAELAVAEVLEERPDDLDALSLLAKIKHIRGELSQAMACWAQIHARSPLIEVAQVQLRAVLTLAMSPERGAGEFLALGPMQLVKKPVAHLELEEVFAQFLARRPDLAKSRAASIAGRYQGKDKEIYKLAVLATAWISELSGDLPEACRILERLGTERGFETDTDRVLALARLNERLGTAERLEAAAHICEYLHRRYGTISLLGRLGQIYRRLGRMDRSREYDRRYLDAFRRRKHKPSFAAIVDVASQRYIPLERLRNLSIADTEHPTRTDPLGRGLTAALEGRLDEARSNLSAVGGPLAQKYLADLSSIAGDAPERAISEYLQAHDADPEDRRLLSHILDKLASSPSQQIIQYFADPAHRGRAERSLDAAIKLTPLRASLWRQMTTLLELDPARAEDAAKARDRALALERAAEREQHAIGRVLAAAAFHFVGKTKGIIHEVWAEREVAEQGRGGNLPPDRILGNVTPDMRRSVQNTFLSVREYVRSKFPHLATDVLDFNYSFKITKEDEPSSGSSAGLPTALAFLSVMLQRPVPQDIASTGELVADAHDVLVVRAIGDAEHKLKAAYHRNLRMLVLPTGNRTELVESSQVPLAVTEEVARFAGNLDEAVRLVFGEMTD